MMVSAPPKSQKSTTFPNRSQAVSQRQRRFPLFLGNLGTIYKEYKKRKMKEKRGTGEPANSRLLRGIPKFPTPQPTGAAAADIAARYLIFLTALIRRPLHGAAKPRPPSSRQGPMTPTSVNSPG